MKTHSCCRVFFTTPHYHSKCNFERLSSPRCNQTRHNLPRHHLQWTLVRPNRLVRHHQEHGIAFCLSSVFITSRFVNVPKNKLGLLIQGVPISHQHQLEWIVVDMPMWHSLKSRYSFHVRVVLECYMWGHHPSRELIRRLSKVVSSSAREPCSIYSPSLCQCSWFWYLCRCIFMEGPDVFLFICVFGFHVLLISQWSQYGPTCSPEGPKLIPALSQEWFQNDPNVSPTWYRNGSDMIPKSSQDSPKTIQQWSQIVPRWSQDDPNMILKLSQIVPRWSRNDPKIIPTWSQNDPKMVRTWFQSSWFIMMSHHESHWWFTMMTRHHDLWWIITLNQYESSWCIMTNHNGSSCASSWPTMMIRHDDPHWWISIIHHDESQWCYANGTLIVR